MVSKIEKLILYNQYEILKNLCPDEKEYYEDEQKTIMYGSDSDIEETASNFFGTSEEVKEEVYGILEMFRWLECSFHCLVVFFLVYVSNSEQLMTS